MEKLFYITDLLDSLESIFLAIVLSAITPSKRTYILMNCGKIVDQAISSDPSLEKIPEKQFTYLMNG